MMNGSFVSLLDLLRLAHSQHDGYPWPGATRDFFSLFPHLTTRCLTVLFIQMLNTDLRPRRITLVYFRHIVGTHMSGQQHFFLFIHFNHQQLRNWRAPSSYLLLQGCLTTWLTPWLRSRREAAHAQTWTWPGTTSLSWDAQPIRGLYLTPLFLTFLYG